MSDTQEIKDLVTATLEAKIIEAFRSTPEMIDQLVHACLSEEVNQYGQKPGYNDKKMPYLTYLAQSAIQKVADETVRAHVAEMAPQIRGQVVAALGSVDVVSAFTDSIVKTAKEGWKIDVRFLREGSDQ